MRFESEDEGSIKAIEAIKIIVLSALQDALKEIEDQTNADGMTWDQLDLLIENYKKIILTIVDPDEGQFC